MWLPVRVGVAKGQDSSNFTLFSPPTKGQLNPSLPVAAVQAVAVGVAECTLTRIEFRNLGASLSRIVSNSLVGT